jgi:hypothetical protein
MNVTSVIRMIMYIVIQMDEVIERAVTSFLTPAAPYFPYAKREKEQAQKGLKGKTDANARPKTLSRYIAKRCKTKS